MSLSVPLVSVFMVSDLMRCATCFHGQKSQMLTIMPVLF